MRRMIIDIPNVLFRVYAAQTYRGDAEASLGLSLHITLNTIKSFYNKYQPNEIAVVFEGHQNWRKKFTETSASPKKYKANRVKDPSMEGLFDLVHTFEELVKKHSAFICISNPQLEGDDCFAGYVQMIAKEYPEDEIIGISGDKDFSQLLKFKNFTLIDPDTKKPRTVEDPDYFIFEKCFRGDGGDNVMPAYPRVRATRLKKAFTDEYELIQILNETWSIKDPETEIETIYNVGELFVENEILMDLEKQPEEIRELIDLTVKECMAETGKFSLFHFTKFLGKYDLKSIAEQASSFAQMFNVSSKNYNTVHNHSTESKAKMLLEF